MKRGRARIAMAAGGAEMIVPSANEEREDATATVIARAAMIAPGGMMTAGGIRVDSIAIPTGTAAAAHVRRPR